MLTGIDVSFAQGEIDWDSVNCDFAFIRMGYITDEALVLDKFFEKNVKGCKIPFGLYVYSYCTSHIKMASRGIEVRKKLDLLGKRPTYPIVLDYEEEFYGSYTKKQNYKLVHAFLKPIEDNDYYVMLYSMKSAIEDWFEGSDIVKYDKWVAQWSNECTYKGAYGIWQYTSKGSVPGINGAVDLNYSFNDYNHIICETGLNKTKTIDEIRSNYLAAPVVAAGMGAVSRTLKRLGR